MEIAGQFLSEKDFQRASGQRLRMLILALGIKFTEAAKDMRISDPHLGNVMRGAKMPLYALYLLCRRRGVTMDWVLLGDPSGLRESVAAAVMQQQSSPEDRAEPKRQARGKHVESSSAKTLAKT